MIRILSSSDSREFEKIFSRLHVDKTGIKIMLPKTEQLLVFVDSLNVPAANILKQELLSTGADAALHKGACNFSVRETPCLLIGRKDQFLHLIKKLLAQPFGLKRLAAELKETLKAYESIPAPMSIGSKRFDFANGPLMMGIINVTPDSFSGDGLSGSLDSILQKAETLIKGGADILDVGGESTRPGSTRVPLSEERKRVIPAIKGIVKRFAIPISVDTSKSQIAEEALDVGAHLVNDVTALLGDRKMVEVVKAHNAPVVIMHHRFKSNPRDSIGEICEFFGERLSFLEKRGIANEKLILDPGIGFGKDAKQNLLILKHLREFKIFGRPILLGPSRKSFIGKVMGAGAGERLPGTLASIVRGHANGAHIFRVHDVREARQALALSQAIEDADE